MDHHRKHAVLLDAVDFPWGIQSSKLPSLTVVILRFTATIAELIGSILCSKCTRLCLITAILVHTALCLWLDMLSIRKREACCKNMSRQFYGSEFRSANRGQNRICQRCRRLGLSLSLWGKDWENGFGVKTSTM